MNIAGVVILYNPEDDVINNIESYLEELDCLFVFDNTEFPNEKIVEKIKLLPRVQYISFCDNMGIAFALNTVLKAASSYHFLLTMDQDSRFCPGMMTNYKKLIEENYRDNTSIAMFSVYQEGMKLESNEIQYVERAINSGSIVDISIASRLGGFDEKLFIDEVDNEFCYRAQLHGYKILCFPQIKMLHHLGDPISGSLFGVKFKGFNHNKLRKYYIARNKVYVIRKYPRVTGYCCKELMKIFIKLLLVEPEKVNRFLYMCKGIKDALAGKMGKLE